MTKFKTGQNWNNLQTTFEPFPKQHILDSSKLKELADDNFKSDENGRKSIQMGRKHCGKRRNCSL